MTRFAMGSIGLALLAMVTGCDDKKTSLAPAASSLALGSVMPRRYGSRMPSPVETAVQTYIRASGERDPAARAKLIEACFAEDGRFVTRSTVIRGRAGVDAMIARALADPQMLGFRVTSAIDAAGTTFRYRSIVERRDGTSMEFFDAGESDADGRIATLLVFAGPLADATE